MLKLILYQTQDEIAIRLSSFEVSTDVDCLNEGQSWRVQEDETVFFHPVYLIFKFMVKLFPAGLTKFCILTVGSEDVDQFGD